MKTNSPDNNKSQVISIRLRQDQRERLHHFSHALGSTPSEAAALLVEEGLRRSEFAFIDFRSSRTGRQAYVQGSRIPVWQILNIARAYAMDVCKVAEHLKWPDYRVQSALNYCSAFPYEIEEALAYNSRYDFDQLKKLLPNITTLQTDVSASTVAESQSKYSAATRTKAKRQRRSTPDQKRRRRK